MLSRQKRLKAALLAHVSLRGNCGAALQPSNAALSTGATPVRGVGVTTDPLARGGLWPPLAPPRSTAKLLFFAGGSCRGSQRKDRGRGRVYITTVTFLPPPVDLEAKPGGLGICGRGLDSDPCDGDFSMITLSVNALRLLRQTIVSQ